MKILKRNYGHRNLSLFLILSLVYLQSVISISHRNSLFSLDTLKSFFLDNYIVILTTALSLFMVFTTKKRSREVVFLSIFLIVIKSFVLLSDSFNKLTLGFNFIYLVFAFYFFIAWELEIEKAAFNPNFSKYDLEKDSRFRLNGTIENENGETVSVYITNIDAKSCFILFPIGLTIELNVKSKYFLGMEYEGVNFKNAAEIVSSYDRGAGFVFTKAEDARVSWSELYKVCLERGLVN